MKLCFCTTDSLCQTDIYIYVASIKKNFTVKTLPFTCLKKHGITKTKHQKILKEDKESKKTSKKSKNA